MNAITPPDSEARAGFRRMQEGTAEDWAKIAGSFRGYARALPDRILDHLKLLDGDFGGFPIDRLHHSLLTATLAHQAGESEEYVVCALLHDIGDTLGSYNHPDIAAAIVKPFVEPEHHWMVEKHGLFQGYYFFHHIGLDRDIREQFRGHPNFDRTAAFCEKYDAPAFDADAACMPLEAFEPMLRRVFAAPKQSVYKKAMED